MPRTSSKRPPSRADVDRALKEFVKESDRAAAVLGVAMVEGALTDLLLHRLLPPRKTDTDSLFDPERALASFAAKIDLAERLGVITNRSADALHLMRRIRNAFAHDVHGCSFQSGGVRDLCDNLRAIFSANATLRRKGV